MEDFLRYMIAAPMAHVANMNTPKTRTVRRAVEAEVIEEDNTAAAQPEWTQQ